ncbi:MAG: TIGR03435 family protein [Acidobacteriota bacterium]|nr:TIGR03435 family protein [Acidobacteriota bacterium]
MHLKKIAAAALWAAGILSAQSAAPAPPAAPVVFEVATIKPAPPLNPAMIMAGKMHVGMKIDAAKVDIGFMSISDLIVKAYDIKGYQVGGPDYITTERFDIVAKMPAGATKEQVPDMLKALLADRFKLTIHKETRTNPVYALIVMKGGPKLREAVPDPAVAEAAAAAAAAPPAKGERTIETLQGTMKVRQNADGQGATVSGTEMGTVKSSVVDGVIHMETSSQSVPQLIEMLSRFVDRPVVDETGLKGKYQIAMDISMQEMMKMAAKSGMMPGGAGGPMGGAPGGGGNAADAASDPGSGGSVFTSLQKMGLKLDSRKEPIETIVIDHVEKAPTEN